MLFTSYLIGWQKLRVNFIRIQKNTKILVGHFHWFQSYIKTTIILILKKFKVSFVCGKFKKNVQS